MRPFTQDLNHIPYDYTVKVINRFKELDLTDRLHEELWTEICDLVQEAVIKTIPKKMKCKQAKWLTEEALQIDEKRREAKGKGEKERYTCLNAEFQRIARRDKKAFLSHQCKEIEGNNRMGKTRDLFKKNQRYQGNIPSKDGLNKGLKEYEPNQKQRILRRGGKNTQKNYAKKKNLHDPDNHDGVLTHLEPDILECEVKWALGSITTSKASRGDGIQIELFQILKEDAVRVLPSICQPIWKTQQWPQDWKRSTCILIPKKVHAKECSRLHSSHTPAK